MGVERPPGDDEDQFPAVDALRRALRRGVRDGANSDVDGLNALVLEWGIVRTLAGPPDARHWVGHAATPGWGPALAASTIPPVLDLHASGAITRLHDIGGLIIDSGGISNQANYEKLLMKRGRFVYYRSPGFESDLREQGLADKIRILPTVMEETPFYILFHRHSAPERLTLFVNTLQRLADSGELAALARRYP